MLVLVEYVLEIKSAEILMQHHWYKISVQSVQVHRRTRVQGVLYNYCNALQLFSSHVKNRPQSLQRFLIRESRNLANQSHFQTCAMLKIICLNNKRIQTHPSYLETLGVRTAVQYRWAGLQHIPYQLTFYFPLATLWLFLYIRYSAKIEKSNNEIPNRVWSIVCSPIKSSKI